MNTVALQEYLRVHHLMKRAVIWESHVALSEGRFSLQLLTSFYCNLTDQTFRETLGPPLELTPIVVGENIERYDGFACLNVSSLCHEKTRYYIKNQRWTHLSMNIFSTTISILNYEYGLTKLQMVEVSLRQADPKSWQPTKKMATKLNQYSINPG